MVPAAAARRFHRDTVDSPRPVKSGWPDAPMTTPGNPPGGVLARWRSGAERATDTAVGLILREGSAGRPVAPAI